jgi:hypothetical protein
MDLISNALQIMMNEDGVDVEPLSVTDNGTYTAPSGKAYSPVTVDVQEQPWQPLQDGYSNFWFELTNDTLSPWLNFSAKNADAVIDWGDGSGEVALDTLTPTHTYSKAGRYVVKVKGVTGIAMQRSINNPEYIKTLRAIELNNDVTSFVSNALMYFWNLANVYMSDTVRSLGSSIFSYCMSLKSIKLSTAITILPITLFNTCVELASVSLPPTLTTISASSFAYTFSLKTITIPSTVSTIGNNAFYSCNELSVVHVQATTPPTLGTSVFTGLPSDFIIYVPVGTGDTYKAAAGWSTYADHIVEEGQTLSRAALRRIQLAETDESEVR